MSHAVRHAVRALPTFAACLALSLTCLLPQLAVVFDGDVAALLKLVHGVLMSARSSGGGEGKNQDEFTTSLAACRDCKVSYELQASRIPSHKNGHVHKHTTARTHKHASSQTRTQAHKHTSTNTSIQALMLKHKHTYTQIRAQSCF